MPKTEAGSRLLNAVSPWYPATAIVPGSLLQMVDAVEQEAAILDVDRLARALAVTEVGRWTLSYGRPVGKDVAQHAAAIAAAYVREP